MSAQPAAEQLKCDLVMKGGITSGIVYPPTVIVLKHNGYNFHQIGGTSVGAVSAAATAAAEFNPDSTLCTIPKDDEGKEKYIVPRAYRLLYDRVSNWLPGINAKKFSAIGQVSNMRILFQAEPGTQALMDLMDAFLPSLREAKTKKPADDQQISVKQLQITRQKRFYIWKLLWVWLLRYPRLSRGIIIGAIAGLILNVVLYLVLFALANLMIPTVIAGMNWIAKLIPLLLFALGGAWVGLHIGGVVSALMQIPGNFYGICTGHSLIEKPDLPNLTDWFCDTLDIVAGLPVRTIPLTFGDLDKKKKIQLKMVTSNLSHAQPYVLPDCLQDFIYNEDDLLKLFPSYIIEHMITRESAKQRKSAIVLPDKYHIFPDTSDIPVVVAARMSLSFPFLISAVPLYTLKTDAVKACKASGQTNFKVEDLQKNWFSDGGMCSNFPIQFFDSWLPSHPTFGINLSSSSQGTSVLLQNISVTGEEIEKKAGQGDAVYLPPADRPLPVEWNDLDMPRNQINQIWNFAHRIFNTVQNYRDTLQVSLPSYRERSIQIRLDADEGGLNLMMPPDVIKRVSRKGEIAGETLGSDQGQFNFTHHQWVRFLVLMKQLETNVTSMAEVLGTPGFTEILQAPVPDDDPRRTYPYWNGKDGTWCQAANSRVAALQALISNWDIAPKEVDPVDGKLKPCFFNKDAPIPDPVLRVTLEV